MGQYSSNMDHDAPGSPEPLLVGSPVLQTKEMARKASITTCMTLDIFAGDKYKKGRKGSWYVVTY